MKEFFKVSELKNVFAFTDEFFRVATETIPLSSACGRILAEGVISDVNLPDFARSTMDGYAVAAASTFGAAEANPAYLVLKDTVRMGVVPDFAVGRGEAARISTPSATSITPAAATAPLKSATLLATTSASSPSAILFSFTIGVEPIVVPISENILIAPSFPNKIVLRFYIMYHYV